MGKKHGRKKQSATNSWDYTTQSWKDGKVVYESLDSLIFIDNYDKDDPFVIINDEEYEEETVNPAATDRISLMADWYGE